MILKSDELYQIRGGGLSLTSSAINAISRVVSTFLKLGQIVGSSVRRAISKTYC